MSGKNFKAPTCACSSALTSNIKITTKINRCPITARALFNSSVVIIEHLAQSGPDENEQTCADLVLEQFDNAINHKCFHTQVQQSAMQRCY